MSESSDGNGLKLSDDRSSFGIVETHLYRPLLMSKVALLRLDDARIPGYPDAGLCLDGQPLCIVSDDQDQSAAITSDSDASLTKFSLWKTGEVTPAIGVATVLYRWCPLALYAFLDLDAWFSLTFAVTIRPGQADEQRFEIGRVKDQVTMGTLEPDGERWRLMLTFDIAALREADVDVHESSPESESGPHSHSGSGSGSGCGTHPETDPERNRDDGRSGRWIPNLQESMLDSKPLLSPAIIIGLATRFVRSLIAEKCWTTAAKVRHEFFIEDTLLDPFGDGIAISPHWLYQSIDLERCTTCGRRADDERRVKLSRCGRCGTATYCCAACQRADWAVHKAVCNMTLEERGNALQLSAVGGLIGRRHRVEVVDNDNHSTADRSLDEWSDNPHFAARQHKRGAIMPS